MPRQSARREFRNFVGGLNTESSPLLFIENTAKDLDNVDLNRDGSIVRRRGLDFETGGAYSVNTFSETDLSTAAISAHEWKSVEGDDSLNFTVVQIGGTLFFHNLGQDSLSTGVMGSISIDAIKTRTDYEKYSISSISADGKLFIVSPAISPSYLQYDEDNNVFTGVKLTLRIRDTEGLDEEISSPQLFGDDVVPGDQTDPEDDNLDTIDIVSNLNNFSDYGPFSPPEPAF